MLTIKYRGLDKSIDNVEFLRGKSHEFMYT